MQGIPAIVAALPREIAALVRGSKADAALLRRGISLYTLNGAIVVAAGMGAERAAVAVETALMAGGISGIISMGLAGACSAELNAGEVAEAGVVVDVRTGERFGTAVSGGCVLVSGTSIASVREKARLAATYGAAMVDMEAATVGRLAAMRGLPFRAIKGVSDGYDFEMEGLGEFTGKWGSFRTGAFALHTALRPAMWGRAMKLGKDSGRALAGLDERLRAIMLEG